MSHSARTTRKFAKKKLQYKRKSTKDTWSGKFMEKPLRKAVTINFADYKEKAKDILNEYGFIVVTDILSETEREEAESLLYDDLLEAIDDEKITDENLKKVVKDIRKGKLHWPRASIPGIVSKGFMSLKGLPQGRFAWKLRLNQKCKEIYQFLHGDDDLVVGMDLPFFNPDNRASDEAELWPHADQNIYLKKGCDNSYQGILYVWDSTERNTSNTVLWPRTWDKEYHTLLDNAIASKLGTDVPHGVYIRDVQDEDTKKKLTAGWKKNARRIQVPAGGLLIFNSRTIHQGYPSGMRLAQTLSWEPKAVRGDDALLKKLQAVHMGIGTTHWASLGIHHGASFMRSYRPEKYSTSHNACVIPTKNIIPVPLKKQIRWCKGKRMKELLAEIKEEYIDCI